jgi:CRISPR system Cascade subunit CasE
VYLSRLSLNPHSAQVRRELGDCHELHRTLMRAFPDAPNGEPGRAHAGLLFRLEPERVRAAGRTAAARRALPSPIVLAQSRLLPDWNRLPAAFVSTPAQVKHLEPAIDALRGGATLRFRLRANAVKAVHNPDEPAGHHSRGKRVALRREEEQLAWLARKGEHGGFHLHSELASPFWDGHDRTPAVSATSQDDELGTRRGRSPERVTRLTFGAVQFDGLLEVDDLGTFRELLTNGVGPAKAYGFGLLSLAPA